MCGLSEILAHPCLAYAHAVLLWRPEAWSLLEGQKSVLASGVLHIRTMSANTISLVPIIVVTFT